MYISETIMSFLSFGFSFKDLYEASALAKLDNIFLSFLEECSPYLAKNLKTARHSILAPYAESTLLLDLAPYVEDFLGILFHIEKEIQSLQNNSFHLAPLYRCKRLFVQRQAAKAFSKEEAQKFDGVELKEKVGA